MINKDIIKKQLHKINNTKPLIHCITNEITVNDCANALTYIGASPTMAHDENEVSDIVSNASALVINLGATEYFSSIEVAINKASKLNIPIVIDPVGVSASQYRRKFLNKLMSEYKIDIIRCNMSEIISIINNKNTSIGVDSQSNEKDFFKNLELIKNYSKKLDTIFCISGKTDIVTQNNETYLLNNGVKQMAKFSGSGCISTCILAAFISTDLAISSCLSAISYINVCAEQSYKVYLNRGIASFKLEFYNQLEKSNLYKDLKIKKI